MKTYSKKDSLSFALKTLILDDTDECINFLVDTEVLMDGEADEYDCLTLFSMASDELESMSLGDIEVQIACNDLYLGKNGFDILDIEQVSESIDIPYEKWVARCYEIAAKIVKADLVEGKAVFGKYQGYIADSSFFAGKCGKLTNHGWILTKSGYIIDPTRWVFENTTPYIYITESDNPDYDRGANNLREMVSPLSNAPTFSDANRVIEVDNKDAELALSQLLDDKKIENVVSIEQAMFIASTSVNELGEHAKTLYSFLDSKGLKAFVPVDNFEMVIDG